MTAVSAGRNAMNNTRLDSIEFAVAEIAAGRAVVVVDDEDRENEGDLIFAAELATPELISFMVRYTSGYICVPLTDADADRLDLPPMHHTNQDRRGTAYTVTVDAREGVSTGISATDRAHTVNLLGSGTTAADDLTRPGHVVPLRAREGGVLTRAGHTEAAVDLARLAGLRPAGVLCEIVSERNPVEMAHAEELREFADTHGLAMISIANLIEYIRAIRATEPGAGRALKASVPVRPEITRVADARVPLKTGVFRALGYRSVDDDREHVVFVAGNAEQLRGGRDVLVRVHSECLTGDVFGSLRCDCGPQLDAALITIAREGRGAVIYLRGHEGRGIGLLAKLAAYGLQDAGADTLDANLDLGLPVDARDYGIAAAIIEELGIASVRLLSNNPDKVAGLTMHGVTVTRRVPLQTHANPENLRYLTTKRDRMGHLLELDVPVATGRTSA